MRRGATAVGARAARASGRVGAPPGGRDAARLGRASAGSGRDCSAGQLPTTGRRREDRARPDPQPKQPNNRSNSTSVLNGSVSLTNTASLPQHLPSPSQPPRSASDPRRQKRHVARGPLELHATRRPAVVSLRLARPHGGIGAEIGAKCAVRLCRQAAGASSGPALCVGLPLMDQGIPGEAVVLERFAIVFLRRPGCFRGPGDVPHALHNVRCSLATLRPDGISSCSPAPAATPERMH